MARKQTTSYYLIALLAIILLSFSSILDNDFVNWDDMRYILDNEVVHSFSGENLKKSFSEEVSDNYHPLTNLSQTVDWVLGGGKALPFHLTSLLLHLLNVVLVFVLIRNLGKAEWAALLVAAIFAVHPMHVESVAWASERKDVLYACFFLLSLIAYVKYLHAEKRLKYLGFAFGAALLSFLSKPAAIPLPFVLLLLDIYHGRSLKEGKLWLEKLPFFGLAILFGLITVSIQSNDAMRSWEDIQWIDQISFAAYGFVMYVVKFLVPVNLSHFYPYPPEIPGYFYLMPVIALAMVGASWWWGRKHKDSLLGFWFFAFMLSVTLQLVPIGATIMADRYSYVPFIGLGLILVWGIEQLMGEEKKYAKALQGIGIAVVLLWAALSWRQSNVWQDAESLWTHRIDNEQFVSAIPYANRGEYYKRTGQTAKAKNDLAKAIQISPNSTAALRLRAKILLDEGKLPAAEADYSKLLQIEDQDPNDWQNYAIILTRMKRNEEALEAMRKAAEKGGDPTGLYMMEGNAAYQNGRFEDAIQAYQAYLERPQGRSNLQVWNILAMAQLQAGRPVEGLKTIDEAINLNPQKGKLYRTKARMLRSLGKDGPALQAEQMA
jgi:tetratricopeptide (TPR) repeat protein